VTISYIHPLWQRACKANDTRNEIDLRTKQRKHLVRRTSKEIHLRNKTRGMGNKCCFGGCCLIQILTGIHKEHTLKAEVEWNAVCYNEGFECGRIDFKKISS
jgi:hypothetical protein